MVPENFTSSEKLFDYSTFSNTENVFIDSLNNLDYNNENFEIPFRLITKQPLTFPCGLGRDIFHILANGDIYPCQLISGMEDYKIGNIENFTTSLMHKNNFLKKIGIELKKNNKCSECWARSLCKYCPARVYLETNCFLPSDKICELRKESIKELILYLVELHNDNQKMQILIKELKKIRSSYEN